MNSDLPFNQSLREERANAASHALGCVLALAALPVLAVEVDLTRQALQPLQQLGQQVFIVTMVLMYLVSAVYHALPVGPAKRLLRKCDHAVIFIFIAGSYTPFALGQIQRGDGWQMLAAVWGLALLGVALKLMNQLRHPLLSTGLYLTFGWMVLVVAQPMLQALPADGLALLVAGGLAYTLGSLFYLIDDRMPYSHLIWHLFVITGSCCHLLAVRHAAS